MTNLKRRWFPVLAVVFVSVLSLAEAHAYIELNGFYTSEAMTVSSGNPADNRTYFEGAVGFSIDKASRYLVGWGYASFSASDTTAAGATTTYSSTQMGPRFVYNFNKSKLWSLGLAYYIVTDGSYAASGSASQKWKGTALKADIGYNFEVNSSFFIGVRMNYSSATYSDSFVGSTWTQVSYSKASVYPSIYGIYYF